MSRRIRLISLHIALLPALACAAVPTVANITDSAAYGPRVAPGSLATIFGAGLAGGTASATTFPIATSLESTTVSVAGKLAPLLYVSPTQINFQVPSATAAGDVNVIVNGPGGASAAYSLTVTTAAPALYQYGTNRALAQNADGSLNSATNPAASGSYITVYLTGQGTVSNPVTDGTAAPTSPLSYANSTATATIGPSAATIQFLGLAPGYSGLAQANLLVPALPTGDYPVVLTIGGYLSASAIVSVSGSGSYTNPLTLTSSVAFANSDTSSVALYNNVAYICGADRIVMVNVTSATSPSYIGEFGDSVLAGEGLRCAVNTAAATPYLVEIYGSPTATTENFAVFSLATPTSPTLLTTASNSYGHMVSLSFSGNYAIVTTSYLTYSTSTDAVISQTGDFLVYDFTNPSAPALLGVLQPSTLPGSGNQNLRPYAEVVNQIYAFVASSTATGTSTSGNATLDVISVGVPGSPTPVSQVTLSNVDILLSFDVSGTILLAAGSTLGQRNPGTPDFDFTGYLTLTTMDLTNVSIPQVIATTTTSLQVNGTFTTAAFTNGVFAIVNNPPDTDDFGPSQLMIVDARTPSALALYPCQTQFGLSGMLTTTNGYLLAPTALGLNIYSLQL